MHMSDALLSPAVGGAFWAGALGVIAYCARKLKQKIDEKIIPLMGVLGAFIFAAQMINFTIPGTGSSGHLGGGMILAVILGPYAAFIVMASVLSIQALFFADGGLLALGCNIWNLGIYPCFIVFPLIYNTLVQAGSSPKRIVVVSMISGVAALQLGAFSVVIETLLSGRSELPFGTFIYMMLPIHLAIGLMEGFITAGVINFVRSARPEILESVSVSKDLSPGISLKNVLAGFLILSVVTGGALSWFASSNPDGLEWAIEKVFGTSELSEHEKGIAPALKHVQNKTSFLPNYSFKHGDDASEKEKSKEAWPNIAIGTSVSGIAGAIMVAGLILLCGLGIKFVKIKRD
ncbi:MAG: energy-coupling factor ABC transporter permease [Nitrospirae bacterium]|nr:energy-coupling factor ABC transporter permease [Nitrospirota bacterium]